MMVLVFAVVAYVVGALQLWRYVGWWARTKHSICEGNDCHVRWPSQDPTCSHCEHNLCKLSAFGDYGWTFVASLLFAWLIVSVWAVRAVEARYGLTDRRVGFFKPGPIVESGGDKVRRLEREAAQRDVYIRELELENGIGLR